MPKRDIKKEIVEFLLKQEWPATSEDIAKGTGISWNTAQVQLLKLQTEGKVKFRKVGRQNQWWLDTKYKKEFLG
ncbi:MAG: hypothetical protein MUP55_02090 [Candidatus Aenigmarchaeota archaeon]|nr:hypothetical protein [Candidatus Aenigmarchaeota archaeon]